MQKSLPSYILDCENITNSQNLINKRLGASIFSVCHILVIFRFVTAVIKKRSTLFSEHLHLSSEKQCRLA